MKVDEITNPSRKVIQGMNSLFITYSINYNPESYENLLNLIEEGLTSDDSDVRKQAQIYKYKLYEDFIRILKS
jgi:hypothetical protein